MDLGLFSMTCVSMEVIKLIGSVEALATSHVPNSHDYTMQIPKSGCIIVAQIVKFIVNPVTSSALQPTGEFHASGVKCGKFSGC